LSDVTRRLLKSLVFVACLGPAMYLTLGAFGLSGISLGADPVHETCGNWALKCFFVTLAMTPLRELNHSVFWLRLRRMPLGLFAFFYANFLRVATAMGFTQHA